MCIMCIMVQEMHYGTQIYKPHPLFAGPLRSTCFSHYLISYPIKIISASIPAKIYVYADSKAYPVDVSPLSVKYINSMHGR